FLRKHADDSQLRFSAEAEQALMQNSWPGNVRELENAVIRGIHLCEGAIIEIEHLGLPCVSETGDQVSCQVDRISSFKDMKHKVIDAFEKKYLTRLMSQHRGNVTDAARFAGKERRDLGKLLKKHGVDPRRFYTTHAV